MPVLGADMEHGTVREWLVVPGDRVHRGQIVAVVETEKADIEIEVFEDGTIGELLVPIGVEVPVGTPIALVDAAGASSTVDGAATVPRPPAGPQVVSPLVRHLVEEHHVDLGLIRPSGAGGRVTRSDVEEVLASDTAPAATPSAAPVATPPAATRPTRVGAGARPKVSPRARRLAARHGVDLDAVVAATGGRAVQGADVEHAMVRLRHAAPSTDRADAGRRAVGRLMARSKREVPHYYLGHDIDLEEALVVLERSNETRPVAERILPAALLLRAVVRAVSDVPEINGHFVDDELRPSAAVHLAVAVSTRAGVLVAPVIRDAEQLSLLELMTAMRDVVGRVRAGTLRAGDVGQATITVTNLGDQGVDEVIAVITPPQVAVVGFGRVAPRPRVVDGVVQVRRVVHVSLAADHRVTHGHRGARFLRGVARALEQPEDLT